MQLCTVYLGSYTPDIVSMEMSGGVAIIHPDIAIRREGDPAHEVHVAENPNDLLVESGFQERKGLTRCGTVTSGCGVWSEQDQQHSRQSGNQRGAAANDVWRWTGRCHVPPHVCLPNRRMESNGLGQDPALINCRYVSWPKSCWRSCGLLHNVQSSPDLMFEDPARCASQLR